MPAIGYPLLRNPRGTRTSEGVDRLRIAVLPLVNRSARAEDQYFAEGMTESRGPSPERGLPHGGTSKIPSVRHAFADRFGRIQAA
jgi:hypothetical protein